MPYGLTNGPGIFQRLMEKILQHLTWSQCLVYIDDVLVFSKTFSDHLNSLTEIFKRLREANVKLNPSKCTFGTNQVVFLGFLVTSEGFRPNPARIDCVR